MPLQANFNRFKEPRGFIKIIEFLVAILAFSTTAGYYSEYTANIPYDCDGKTLNRHLIGKFSYPFEEIDGYLDAKECKGTTVDTAKHDTLDLPSSLKSSSEFFVFVGVVAFLYCIVAGVYYIFFEDAAKYGPGGTGRAILSFATVDFVVTVVFVLFWFCGSVAWAVGLTKLKDETDAEECKDPCKVTDKANYAGITISVLFGFLSCFLWCANVWFVFKETIWHKEAGATETAEQPSGEIPRQEVPGETVP